MLLTRIKEGGKRQSTRVHMKKDSQFLSHRQSEWKNRMKMEPRQNERTDGTVTGRCEKSVFLKMLTPSNNCLMETERKLFIDHYCIFLLAPTVHVCMYNTLCVHVLGFTYTCTCICLVTFSNCPFTVHSPLFTMENKLPINTY